MSLISVGLKTLDIFFSESSVDEGIGEQIVEVKMKASFVSAGTTTLLRVDLDKRDAEALSASTLPRNVGADSVNRARLYSILFESVVESIPVFNSSPMLQDKRSPTRIALKCGCKVDTMDQ